MARESSLPEDGRALDRLYQEVQVAGIPLDLEDQIERAILSDRGYHHDQAHAGKIAFMNLAVDPAEVDRHARTMVQAHQAAQQEQSLDRNTAVVAGSPPRARRL